MSARTEHCLALGYIAAAGTRDHDGFADAVLRLFDAAGLVPRKLSYLLGKAVTRAFKESSMRSLIADSALRRLTIWSDMSVNAPEVVMYLRDDPKSPDTDHRHGGAVVDAGVSPEALVEFARALVACTPLVSAGIAGFRNHGAAQAEGWNGAPAGLLDAATDARLYWDAMHDRRTRDKLRRLYPITIIGPAIWAQLPPMPAFDPMPTVEELGDCKIVTAWPELCDPRDPAFLRGTRALREWLWPYTIQNPADHVDNDPPCADVAT